MTSWIDQGRFGFRSVLSVAFVLGMTMLLTACPKTGTSSDSGEAATDNWPPMPDPAPFPEFTVPEGERFALDNGVPVILVQSGKVPLVSLQLNLYRGGAADPAGKGGLAAFTADMLNEGTDSRSALDISEQALDLAASMGFGASLSYSYATLNSLEETLDESLGLFADLVQNSSIAADEVERVREQRRARLLAENDQLPTVGMKVLRKVLFGDSYMGRPVRGRLETLDAIKREDLESFYRSVWTSDNAGLIVVSRLSKEKLLPLLNRHLGAWSSRASGTELPSLPAVSTAPKEGRSVYWVHKKGAQQSYVAIGNSGPAWAEKHSSARSLGNAALGGSFSARLNMNLREDKGYTYGARSSIEQNPMAGMFAARASVKTSTTAASITEFLSEIASIRGDRPVSEAEFGDATGRAIQGYPARFESLRSIRSQVAGADALRRPENWWVTYADRIRSVDLEAARAGLAEYADPENLVVVVVGDWLAVGADVEGLGLGPIQHLDASGSLVEAPVIPSETAGE